MRAADGDVGLHVFHAAEFDVVDELGMLLVGVLEHLAGDAAVADLDDGRRPGLAGGAHELHGEFIRHVDHVEHDVFTLLDGAGVVDEQVGELGKTRVGHMGWRLVRPGRGSKRKGAHFPL